jgi:hypothetical protein
MDEGLPATLVSIAIIAVFALVAGAIVLIHRGERPKGLLMLVAAAVLLANVAIWAV